jgi:hypothetical protein
VLLLDVPQGIGEIKSGPLDAIGSRSAMTRPVW